VFAAALAFSGKATAGVGAIVAGFLLQRVVGWPLQADPRHIDPAIVTRLGLVTGILVPLLFLIPLALASRYSITRAKHMQTRQELDRRRAAARTPSTDEAHLDLEIALAPPKATHI
jgi:Na+/melibiose symporter-like transporter